MASATAQSFNQAASRANSTWSSAGSAVSTPSSSVWDRISTWASEHKAAVYTIAGVTLVVTGAGVVYYVSGSGAAARAREAAGEQKKSKKERRKAKKDAQETQEQEATSPAGPAAEGNLERPSLATIKANWTFSLQSNPPQQ